MINFALGFVTGVVSLMILRVVLHRLNSMAYEAYKEKVMKDAG
jgi:hypothetical protein